MSTATTDPTTAVPSPLEFSGRVTKVPTLEEIESPTAVPERRVVYRGVDWSFYEQLVDSIPESSAIHVDYDGKDLEVMSKGWEHDRSKRRLGRIVDIVAEEYGIPFDGNGETTWKRPDVGRGLEADESFYFQPEKLAAAAESASRRSNDIADYPNPTWRSRSTSHVRKLTARAFTLPSKLPKSGGSTASRSSSNA